MKDLVSPQNRSLNTRASGNSFRKSRSVNNLMVLTSASAAS